MTRLKIDPVSAEDRIAVSTALSRFRRQWNAKRLIMYRQHLQVTLTDASPLLALVERDHGLDVASQMWRLRPPPAWPDVRATSRWRSLADLAFRACGRHADAPRHPLGEAIEVRGSIAGRSHLVLRICERSMELSMRIGEVAVRTDEGRVTLRLGFSLPELVASAAPGRPIGLLVDHPWFSDPGWTVESVVHRRGRTELRVTTGQAAFAMPWRRLLPPRD